MRGLLLLLLALASQARAQSPVTLMPEGSRESLVGLAYGEAWKRQGSNERQRFLSPFFSIHWSNGAFVEGLSGGWMLSSDPLFQYGPILALRGRDDGAGGSQLVPGGFVQWRVLHNVELAARTGIGSRDGKPQAELAASWFAPLSADHTLVLRAATERAELWSNRLGARWHWRVGHGYTLVNAVTGIRLAGSSAHAPGVQRRSSVAWSSALLVEF
ncbi:MAG: hypothetical protein K0R43_2465 [Pseudoduganella sp.]|jgi:hypothetical protein|nr:hypothetical protein [Pseudoduganella sp.]